MWTEATAKTPELPKVIYRFNATSIRISEEFCRNRQIHSKIHMGLQIRKSILEKKNKNEVVLQFLVLKLTTELQ